MIGNWGSCERKEVTGAVHVILLQFLLEQCCLFNSLASFQSLLPLPTSKLGPSGTDSWVGGFVYILGPCGSLPQTLLWGWEFLLLLQPPIGVFSQRFEALFPGAGALGCAVCLAPQFFLPVYPHANVGPPASPAAALLGSWAAALPWVLSTGPVHPNCPSLPLLLIWMNVSSLSPWLSDLHTVRFSVSSGFFCFLFKFVVLLLLVEGGTGYLPMPSSWPDCYSVFKLVNLFFLQYLFNLLSVPSILVFISRS